MSELSNIYTLTTVIAVILMGVVFVGLCYVEIAARRVVKRLANDEFGDEILAAEARTADRGGFRYRVKWLKSRQAGLPGAVRKKAIRVVSVHMWCKAAALMMLPLWMIGMLIDWLHPTTPYTLRH